MTQQLKHCSNSIFQCGSETLMNQMQVNFTCILCDSTNLEDDDDDYVYYDCFTQSNT